MKNDPAHTYYAEFKGKTCNLRNLEKTIIRRSIMQSDIVNSQVSGTGDDAIVANASTEGQPDI